MQASPAIALAPPFRNRDRWLPRRQLRGELAAAVHRKRGAVEHKLVLAADLIDIKKRQPRLGHARNGHLLALRALFQSEGRAVRHDKDFSAALGEEFGDSVLPDILADRDAKPYPVEIDRLRHWAGGEDALFVEHAVIRQIDLITQRLDPAAGDKRDGVVDLPVLPPRRPDEKRGAAVDGDGRESVHRVHAGLHERRLEDEILRRIACNEKLGEHDEVRVRGARLLRADRASAALPLKSPTMGFNCAHAMRKACVMPRSPPQAASTE